VILAVFSLLPPLSRSSLIPLLSPRRKSEESTLYTHNKQLQAALLITTNRNQNACQDYVRSKGKFVATWFAVDCGELELQLDGIGRVFQLEQAGGRWRTLEDVGGR
jgi:hypothetical protein